MTYFYFCLLTPIQEKNPPPHNSSASSIRRRDRKRDGETGMGGVPPCKATAGKINAAKRGVRVSYIYEGPRKRENGRKGAKTKEGLMKQRKKVSTMHLVPQETIESNIFLLRGKKVMLDRDLARLYEVDTKYLKRQVRRNCNRFPADFMFKLSREEFKNWRCQFVTSNFADKMGLRYPPYAFTEPGVAMLSSVLNSNRAIRVNIQIIRTFIKLREMLMSHAELKRKIEAMEKKYDTQFKVVFDAIRELVMPPERPKRRIGFHSE